jgi:EF hand
MTSQGLDPGKCRAYAAQAETSAATIISLAADLRIIDHQGQLAMADPACKLLSETFDELGFLSKLLRSKAAAMEAYDKGNSFGWALSQTATADLERLEASLNDQNGSKALVGDNVLNALLDNFDAIDRNADGKISPEELEQAKKSANKSIQVSAQYLLDNPALHASIMTAQTKAASAGRRGYFELGSGNKYLEPVSKGTFNREDLVATTEQNQVIRALVESWKQLEDGDGKISMKDVNNVLKAGPNSKYSKELVAACQYLKDHKSAFTRLDSASKLRIDEFEDQTTDGIVSFNDLLAVAVDQQSFVADAKLARKTVVEKFPNIAFTKDVMDIRLVSDDGLKALAASALSAAPSLRMQVETVAFLPENTSAIRNQLITAYYVKIGNAKTAWLNPGLVNPLDVTDPNSTGLDWLVIGANASNSVGPVISGQAKLPYLNDIIGHVGENLNQSERNQMAEGNQRIFTDVAIRNAALMEAFPTGKPVTTEELTKFLGKSLYANKEQMFDTGDQQMRDSMLFALAAREETDPMARKQLSYMATTSTAIHEQASIQKQLEGIFGAGWSDDGFRGLLAKVGPALIGTSAEELGTGLLGVLKFGDFDTAGPGFNLQRDLDDQKTKVALPKNNPIGALDLASDLSPAGVTSVEVGGKTVTLDGSSLNLANLAGWETVKGSGNKNFEIDPKVWAENGVKDSKTFATKGGPVTVGSDKPTRPLGNTAATDWTDYEQRMWFIANLFQQYTFEPKVMEWNESFTSGRVKDKLAYLPSDVKKTLTTK